MVDAIDAAMRLLSYRPRSESEVRRRLSRRYSPALVDETIDSLKQRGLLDDAAFASSWRESRERHRPRGLSAIRWELLRMGVDREIVEGALEGLDEEENAYRAGIGAVRRIGQVDYGIFRSKIVAYLRRRGFAAEAISSAVQRVWEELSDPVYGHETGKGHEKQQKDEIDRRSH